MKREPPLARAFRSIGIDLKSLIVRIVIFAMLLALLGMAVRLLVLLPLVRHQIVDMSASRQLALAEYVARDVDAKIRERSDLVARLAAALPKDLLTDPARLEAWLKDRQEINPLFSGGLMVLPPDGRGAIADFPALPDRRLIDYGRRDWFLEAESTAKVAMGKPVRDDSTGGPAIVFATALPGIEGTARPVLAGVAAISSPGFLGLLEQSHIGESGGFLLISPRDGIFVAATDPAKILAPLPEPGVNKLHDKGMKGYRGTGITTNAQGVEDLSAMVSVPSTGWFLVARVPTSEALSSIADIRTLIVRGSLFILAFVVIGGTFVLRRFLRPLTNASRLIHGMAEGEIPLQPVPVGRRDEVGTLVEGFNFLLTRVRDNESRLAYMAHHDALTGLVNRTVFEGRLADTVLRFDRSGGAFALLFVDLNDFKSINDTYGHDVGDAVLIEVARRLQEHVRRVDTVARLGGDEFVILLLDLKHPREDSEMVARKLRDHMAEPILSAGGPIQVGMSIGIALYPEDGVAPSQLLAKADQAMYGAKRESRKRFAAFGK